MQASELADLALSKLEFLEVTKKGLSKLQILLVELEVCYKVPSKKCIHSNNDPYNIKKI